MVAATPAGRHNQRSRTRKDLLEAASRLLKQGCKLSIEEVAEEARVSRATAYRYFPNVEMLLVEAPLEGAMPDATDIFRGASDDPVERVNRVDAALHEMMAANEQALRMMLAQSLQRGVNHEAGIEYPIRQNRRTALIEEALAPAREQFQPNALESLTNALAVMIGTESMVAFKDVLQLNESRAEDIRRWAIRALIDAAREGP